MAVMAAGSTAALPSEHAERAVYIVDGTVTICGARLTGGRMAVLDPGGEAVVHAETAARVMMSGACPRNEHGLHRPRRREC